MTEQQGQRWKEAYDAACELHAKELARSIALEAENEQLWAALVQVGTAIECRVQREEQLQAKAALADDIIASLPPGVKRFWLNRRDALTKPSSAGVDTEGSE